MKAIFIATALASLFVSNAIAGERDNSGLEQTWNKTPLVEVVCFRAPCGTSVSREDLLGEIVEEPNSIRVRTVIKPTDNH